MSMNESLRELQGLLFRVLNKLDQGMDTVEDEETADVVSREMMEVNHRLAMVGGLLFAAQSKDLDAKVAEVRKSTRKLKAAAAEIENLRGFVDAFSDFLGLVDDVIDLAKRLVI